MSRKIIDVYGFDGHFKISLSLEQASSYFKKPIQYNETITKKKPKNKRSKQFIELIS